MAKPNYQFEKRQRELAKKKKKEEKLQQRRSGVSDTQEEGVTDAPVGEDDAGDLPAAEASA